MDKNPVTASTISQILLWAVLLAVVVALFALARQVGVLYERVAPVGALVPRSGPAAGAVAPQMTLPTLDGRTVTIGGTAERARLLFFVASQCPVCKKLLPIAVRFARTEHLDLILAGDDDPAVQRLMVEANGVEDLPFLNSRELGLAYGVEKLPHAVLIDDHGVIIARGLVNSREHLESLIVARDMKMGSVQDFLQARSAAQAK